MKTNRIMLFLGSIAVFAFLLVAGVNLMLKKIQPLPSAGPERAPLIEDEPLSEDDGPEIRIQEKFYDSRPVIYTAGGFEPQTLAIQAGDSAGCLISVVNRSGQAVKVGVSPHDPAGDPGADYGEIQSDKAGILDVRYPGLTQISLHNHFRPEHGFTVTYGPGCW